MRLRPRLVVAAALLTVLPLTGACSRDSGDSGTPTGVTTSVAAAETFTVYVADKQVPCTGVAPMECLQVRRDPNGPWELHYFGIEGFDYEPGYTYTLEVEERPWVNPPADAPSVTWHLVKVIAKQPA
ncbi:DUF4377 domain-containing protein [Nocardia sp. NPDC050406]|uniref:DUF4377 domain-containing protein n=1 Tax=Nocardia sp. NPDC050406 TaxID=3364318 RepID=UPI0037B2FC86